MTIRKRTRKQQNTYEQKIYAVKEVLEKKRHKKDVAIELDIHINSITLWIKTFKESGAEGLLPYDQKRMEATDHSEEIQRLQKIEMKYNEQLLEIEILKKFQVFLKESE